MLARFKGGLRTVFLISLKAGGFGLNLTEADYCFLFDPRWNPADAVLPVLTDQQRHWLVGAISTTYGPHPWIKRLQA